MFGKMSNTWSLMRESWAVLKQDKAMMLFPLLSSICCLVVMASFALPIISSDAWGMPDDQATTEQQVGYYVGLFIFYFCNYFIITFFNSAVVACAMKRMQGGDPTVGDGFRVAFSRLHYIFGWALLSAKRRFPEPTSDHHERNPRRSGPVGTEPDHPAGQEPGSARGAAPHLPTGRQSRPASHQLAERAKSFYCLGFRGAFPEARGLPPLPPFARFPSSPNPYPVRLSKRDSSYRA